MTNVNITVRKGPLHTACYILGVDKDEVLTKKRTDELVQARIMAAWAYDVIGFHPSEIGEILNRTRPTVLHMLKSAEIRPFSDPDFRDKFKEFKNFLNFY